MCEEGYRGPGSLGANFAVGEGGREREREGDREKEIVQKVKKEESKTESQRS